MNQSERDVLAHEFDPRALVAEELAAAMQRLAIDMPRMDAAQMLRLSIAYFAGVHALHFGHTATVKELIKIARRGIWFATEELVALQQQEIASAKGKTS